ncbi:Testis-specific protein TSX [Apodemus speciosus]|uniref:Testis-specific protein TSX n=1 Tax=Apodemus speciosus TaxID=105296 RepID=A0ABQ0FUX9_APOSI
MSEKPSPETSEAECSAVDFPEFEDEERWLFKGDDTNEQEDEPMGHAESLRLQDILQEDKVSSTDDNDPCQAGCTEDDESSHSDSDIDDNVKVIIGNIKANPSKYMEALADLNSQADQDLEIPESV